MIIPTELTAGAITMAPASLDAFQAERTAYIHSVRLPRRQRIAVIGSGVLGLTIARDLRAAGADVTIFSERGALASTSAMAAGLIEPIAGTADPDGQRLELRAFRHSYRAWAAYAAAFGNRLVALRRVTTYTEPRNDALPWHDLVDGYRELSETELHPLYPGSSAAEFLTYVVDTPLFLVSLRQALVERGVGFVPGRIESLDGLGFDAVVNASGLGAAKLAADPTVYRGDGHIVRVERPSRLHDVFMDERRRIEDVARDPHRVNMLYAIPRIDDVVLGGTLFDARECDVEPEPRAGMAEHIVELVTQIEPRLAGARILDYQVGARPRRLAGTRIELDQDTYSAPVLHAYGAGGSGWTLAHGLAREAVMLLADGVWPLSAGDTRTDSA